jgi:PII-like signaling protein
VEFIDNAERINQFLAVVHEFAPGSFVTREQVHVVHGHSPTSD